MTGPATPPYSEDLMALVFVAADHAVASLAGGGPLVPLAFAEAADGSKTLHRFGVERLEQAPEAVRHFGSSAPDTLVRLVGAWDGYVTINGVRTDAVMLEAAERGIGQTFLFVQRYRPKAFLRKAVALGNLGYMGQRTGSLFDVDASR